MVPKHDRRNVVDVAGVVVVHDDSVLLLWHCSFGIFDTERRRRRRHYIYIYIYCESINISQCAKKQTKTIVMLSTTCHDSVDQTVHTSLQGP